MRQMTLISLFGSLNLERERLRKERTTSKDLLG